MLSEYPDILTTDEACEALRIGYNALYDLLQSGKLKAYRNGRLWRIPKKSVIEYILEQSKRKRLTIAHLDKHLRRGP
jgi:excisionase family DNA binding protein